MPDIDITSTPQYMIAKITIADRLQQELDSHFSNILGFADALEPVMAALRSITDNFNPNVNFTDHINNFSENMHRYIPSFEPSIDGSNIYVESIRDILSNSFQDFNEGSDILRLLNVSSLDDVMSMDRVTNNFVESVTSSIMGGTFQSIMMDFNLDEFRIGSLLSIAEHNLNIFDISNSLTNITSIGTNLINNFADVANLESLSNMFNSIPSIFDNLFLDKLGNLDFMGLLNNLGLPSLHDIMNIFDIKSLMNMIVGNITGGMADLMGGLGSCACSLVLGPQSISGVMSNISNFVGTVSTFVNKMGGIFSGGLNSTILNVLDGTPIGDFFNGSEAVDSIRNQITRILDPNSPWGELFT